MLTGDYCSVCDSPIEDDKQRRKTGKVLKTCSPYCKQLRDRYKSTEAARAVYFELKKQQEQINKFIYGMPL